MNVWKIAGFCVLGLAIMVGLSYAFGWIGVHQKGTIGKAMQNVEREVFEQTNSFTKAKRQEAIKLYKEYNSAKTLEEKQAIATIASMSFADFDEDRFISNYKLLNWIKEVKY